MKRFSFRLSRLERLRALEEQAARARLVRASGDVEDRQRERERRESELQRALQADLPPKLAEDSRSWRQRAEWRESNRLAVIAASEREARAMEAARRAEEAHAEAARAHRVLERLRDRKYRRWRQEADREERKFLDEIHLLRLRRERLDRRG